MEFLIDGNMSYTYAELLNELNSRRSYVPYYQTGNLYSFFVNFLFAVSRNQSITLIDSDISSSELVNYDSVCLNQEVSIGGYSQPLKSLEDLIRLCLGSTSEITLFTSGTTGQPKKVVHSLQSLTRLVRVGEKQTGKVWGFAYNPTHMAGTQVFFQALLNGNTIVNVFNKQRGDIYELIEKTRISHISATPTFYRLLLPKQKEYPWVERVTLGGEKSELELYNAIKLIFPGAKISNIYASTEAGSIFASNGDIFQIPEADKDRFKIVNDELLIHRSLLGEGVNSSQMLGDYYHTNDLVEWVDEERGTFKFKSRKNELINVGGYKVNPSEVEKEITMIDGVKQVLVYGKSNSVLGNILCADIVLFDDSVTELKVRTVLSEKLQDFKIPRRIKFVECIELTRTGKTKRK